MRKLTVSAVIFVSLAVSAVFAQNEPTPTPGATGVEVGEIGELCTENGSNAPVPVATTQEAFHEFIKAAVADDDEGTGELVAAGRLFMVKQGTKVRKIDVGWLGSGDEVRILDGVRRGQKGFVNHQYIKLAVRQLPDQTEVKTVPKTPGKEDADDAAEEARYLKEIAELLVNNEPLAKSGADVRAQQAAFIITHGKKLAAREGEDIMAFQYWNAAKVFCARGIPPAATQRLMEVYGDVITGMDLSPEHPEDGDLLSSDDSTVDHELPVIMRDAISGSQAAAKRLHVVGLQDLSAKERCERIIAVLRKRYSARAEREREKQD